MKKAYQRILCFCVAMALVIGAGIIPTMAIAAAPTWDGEHNHTAFITEKSASWTDENSYLAELILAINGTQVIDPLDVIICLDRSGSMDMNYIHELSATHNASCPCLNQAHFYLRPVKEENGAVVTVGFSDTVGYSGTIGYSGVEPADKDEIIDNGDGKIIVYNGELEKWVLLSTNEEHVYYQFSGYKTAILGHSDYRADNTYELGAYHFGKDNNGNYVRISKWDTVDIRKRDNAGVWDHADETDGCYDRWIEAKDAVSAFSAKLLDANIKNNVALVPFSIRDSQMATYLNVAQNRNYRQWLIDKGFVDDIGSLASYDSKVMWTDDVTEIDDMLDGLFTTSNTDYVYALSSAYNMLTERDARAKEEKRAVVVFLSDGVPDPASGSSTGAFFNASPHILELRNAIINEPGSTWESALPATGGSIASGYANFWNATSGTYQRHDVKTSYLTRDESDTKYIGAPGLGVEFAAVSYMIDETRTNLLPSLITSNELYLKITASDSGTSTKGKLTDALLDMSIFPGGRFSVLRDVVSEYYYVPIDESRLPDSTNVILPPNGTAAKLPAGVTIEGTIENGQTIVWDIGRIFEYAKEDEPSISIPLVLREQYRNVSQVTYYPTNADEGDGGKPSYTPDPVNAEDGPETGAKLYYTDPDDEPRYDTIGTPKLPVGPVNPTQPTSTNITLTATKNLTGRALNDGEFRFELKDKSTGQVVSTANNIGGTVTFPPIPYSEAGEHIYTVSEVGNSLTGITYDTRSFDVAVKVTKIGGVLVAAATYPAGGIVFENTYTPPNPGTTEITLTATKNLTGRAINDDEFRFELKDKGTGQVISTGTNTGGTVTFPPINYSKAGRYEYTVTEIDDGLPGITYDSRSFDITVEVVDKSGTLEATPIYPAGGIVFNNRYTTPNPGTSVAFFAQKRLTGAALTDDMFTFTVRDSENNIVATATNNSNGNIEFSPIEFSAPGVYVYTVEETRGWLNGITYDRTVYTVTVTVRADEDGLYVEVSYPQNGIIFRNQYRAPEEESDSSDDGDSSEPVTPPVAPTTPPTTPDSSGGNPNEGDFTPIGDTPVPLSRLPQYTTILDDGVPLGSLPMTGGKHMIPALFGMAMCLLLSGAFVYNQRD